MSGKKVMCSLFLILKLSVYTKQIKCKTAVVETRGCCHYNESNVGSVYNINDKQLSS